MIYWAWLGPTFLFRHSTPLSDTDGYLFLMQWLGHASLSVTVRSQHNIIKNCLIWVQRRPPIPSACILPLSRSLRRLLMKHLKRSRFFTVPSPRALSLPPSSTMLLLANLGKLVESMTTSFTLPR